jgi:hypothetical protein
MTAPPRKTTIHQPILIKLDGIVFPNACGKTDFIT